MKHFEYVILLLVAIQATSFARYLLIDVQSEGDGNFPDSKPLKKHGEACGENYCDRNSPNLGDCETGLKCTKRTFLCGPGSCMKPIDCKDKLKPSKCMKRKRQCKNKKWAKKNCKKTCRICEMAPLIVSDNGTEERTIPKPNVLKEDSDLKFDDKCCKKSGVPDQCMGLCKERIPNQNAAIMFPVDQCDEHLDKIKKCMKKGCANKLKDVNCQQFQQDGLCKLHDWMKEDCPKTCGFCNEDSNTELEGLECLWCAARLAPEIIACASKETWADCIAGLLVALPKCGDCGCYIVEKVGILPQKVVDLLCKKDLALPTFAGLCRYESNQFDFIKEKASPNALKCHEQCQTTHKCVAFAFSKDANACALYEGGPYTHGEGRSGSTCYIMPEATVNPDNTTSNETIMSEEPPTTEVPTTLKQEGESCGGGRILNICGGDCDQGLKCIGSSGGGVLENEECWREGGGICTLEQPGNKEKQLGESCKMKGFPTDCGDCAEGLVCRPGTWNMDWTNCGVCTEKPDKCIDEGESCIPWELYKNRKCCEGTMCRWRPRCATLGRCKCEGLSTTDTTTWQNDPSTMDTGPWTMNPEPWTMETTTGSTTTAEEPELAYFDQTCCKEKGVPAECMGQCISPRVSKQQGRSIVSNEDYAASGITICTGMDKVIEQCVVVLPRAPEGNDYAGGRGLRRGMQKLGNKIKNTWNHGRQKVGKFVKSIGKKIEGKKPWEKT